MPGLGSAKSFYPPLPSGIPGIDFRVGADPAEVTNIGSVSNLPANCSYDANVSGIRCGSTVADFEIYGWDFRGINAVFYLQNTKHITFNHCLFDLSNYSVHNVPFMANRSGTPTYSVKNCTFDGKRSAVKVTDCLRGRITLCEYSDFINWPADWCNPTALDSVETIIRFNRVEVASTCDASHGLHSDCMQISEWVLGNGLTIDGNIFIMRAKPTNGTDVDRITNFSGDWTPDLQFTNNIMITEDAFFTMQFSANPGSASVQTVSGNYIAGQITGPLYDGAAASPNLVVPSIKDLRTGAVLSMSWNDEGSVSSVTHIP
jgi:hypothetical protein